MHVADTGCLAVRLHALGLGPVSGAPADPATSNHVRNQGSTCFLEQHQPKQIAMKSHEIIRSWQFDHFETPDFLFALGGSWCPPKFTQPTSSILQLLFSAQLLEIDQQS